MSDVVIFAGYTDVKLGTKPCGAYTIASVFRTSGMSTMVIDHTFNIDVDVLNSIIDKYVTDTTKVICFSTTLLGTFSNLDFITPVLARCKQNAPSSISIVGGAATISGTRPTCGFDYGVIGQGETAILAILGHELYGRELIISETVHGTKYVNDKVYSYDEYNTNHGSIFTKQDLIFENETLVFEYGRGCVFKCGYCYYDLTGKRFGDYTKNEETLYSTLMSNYDNFGSTRYIISDDTINDSLEKALLLERVVNRLPFKFEFGGYMRIELFQKNPEMIEIYRTCGLRGIKFGIETFNKKAGLTVGKGFGEQSKDVLETLYSAYGNEVAISCNFLVGLPYDTLDDLEKQVQWLVETEAVGHVWFNALGIRRDNPGDLITKKSLQGYYTESEFANKDSTVLDWVTPIMTRNECQKLCESHFRRVMSRRKTVFKQLDGFAIPIIMQKHSIPELNAMPSGPGVTQGLIDDFFSEKVLKYSHALQSAPVLSSTDPTTWSIPDVLPKQHNKIEMRL
jgi:hypothetical protein